MNDKLKFFFVKKKLLTLYSLRDHICEDIILKITGNFIKTDRILDGLSIVNSQFHRNIESCKSYLNETLRRGPQSLLYFISNRFVYGETIPSIYSSIDIFRILYLKDKMSKLHNREQHYSKYYNTWIKFQYYLTKTNMALFEDCKPNGYEKYGFQNIKKFSDVLNKD